MGQTDVPAWDYIRTGLGRHGRSLSENNFAKERRDWLAILLREILQNALDARVSRDEPVRVRVEHKVLDAEGGEFISRLITREHLTRYNESVPHVRDDHHNGVTTCLVVEDFGTCGLTGQTDNPELDGAGQNWNAFWFREGEGGKENSSGNGGAGQGKITYFSTSAIRTIFSYTVRADDGRQALFGASSFLRDYDHDGHKWKRDAYWGVWKGEDLERAVLPAESEAEISRFRRHLALQRQSNQPGLSLIIPSPREFAEREAIEIALAEFFVPILRGDLVLQIGSTKLDSKSALGLADAMLTDSRARELSTCMTKAYRGFLAEAVGRSKSGTVISAPSVAAPVDINEKLFSDEQLANMRSELDSEGIVSVRFSTHVKPRNGQTLACMFDVHLAAPFDLDRPEQAVIRRDLLVGEEPIGGGKLRQRARGLTLISDEALSRLLLSAEEATHLRWNTRLPRLGEYYRSGPETVSLIRNAMARLLDVLTGGDQKRDFKLLAKYFSAPGADVPAKGVRTRSKATNTTHPKPVVPPARPKLLAMEALEDGCRVRPARQNALSGAKLPLNVTVEFAYEGLDRDAFAEYDPLDFDLSDGTFRLSASGATIVESRMNVLRFRAESENFELKLTGFDRNLRLRMRLMYEEAEDAAAVES